MSQDGVEILKQLCGLHRRARQSSALLVVATGSVLATGSVILVVFVGIGHD
eukprot:CAMPEP_0177540098 /NCGR_PEP_ID=MMETSP0369-20130122/59376_1 /TAXON_ID=447022 ORGANISM="Scrippsiella hangoei-like, Strain SHHI-4" /NCGR_SAMPLE_ID=MMETSP0369 /ASSEMBLY_ACC=CAM_ASM_000364 /LENGTH=50 /DNA_ID=CAMNT_0019023247 /DNA_START=128 /DNA_END=277 /DNA_ORIENTATION=+